MRSIDSNTILMVDYEIDTSMTCEYMLTIDYNRLLKTERKRTLRIKNHKRIDSTEKA